MRNKFRSIVVLAILFVSFTSFSCRKSMEDEFKDVNEDVKEKYLSSIEVISEEFEQNEYINIVYDDNDRISTISYGEDVHYFFYDDNNNLTNVTMENELKNIEDLFLEPFDIVLPTQGNEKVRTGDVLEYDSKQNPSKIEIFREKYGWIVGTGYGVIITDTLICELLYDPNPNPFFYALKASGIISVLDNVDLIFGVESPKIIQARQLLPYNNIKTITFKDKKNLPVTTIKINSTYDEDGYPDFAQILVIEENFYEIHKAYYSYK